MKCFCYGEVFNAAAAVCTVCMNEIDPFYLYKWGQFRSYTLYRHANPNPDSFDTMRVRIRFSIPVFLKVYCMIKFYLSKILTLNSYWEFFAKQKLHF